MDNKSLENLIRKKRSFLCIGLDPDLDKLPEVVKKTADPLYEFNKSIINATHDVCVAYKPNTAFYEVFGAKGWKVLEKTVQYIRDTAPGVFIIIDAKRGDIGNTSRQYARAFFEKMNADAVTVAPYMGKDSVEPFLEYENKMTVLLALTSNGSAEEFELIPTGNEKLYERVIRMAAGWRHAHRLMYVAGATRPSYLKRIRALVPEAFLLIPGVGAQGGSLAAVCENGMNDRIGILVNSSRSILYAGNKADFDTKAREAAIKLRDEMGLYIN